MKYFITKLLMHIRLKKLKTGIGVKKKLISDFFFNNFGSKKSGI